MRSYNTGIKNWPSKKLLLATLMTVVRNKDTRIQYLFNLYICQLHTITINNNKCHSITNVFKQ